MLMIPTRLIPMSTNTLRPASRSQATVRGVRVRFQCVLQDPPSTKPIPSTSRGTREQSPIPVRPSGSTEYDPIPSTRRQTRASTKAQAEAQKPPSSRLRSSKRTAAQEEELNTCRTCNASFSRARDLRRHEDSHSGVSFCCENEGCEYETSTKKYFQEHVKRCSTRGLYKCDKCDERFRQSHAKNPTREKACKEIKIEREKDTEFSRSFVKK